MAPSLTGIAWVDWLLIAAAVATASGVLWRGPVRGLVRVTRAIYDIYDEIIGMKDTVHDTKAATDKLTVDVDEIRNDQAKMARRIGFIERKLNLRDRTVDE